MNWKMELCTSGRSDLYEKTFENFDDGVDWLRQNHPILLESDTFKSVIGDEMRQFGTNYYWAQFTRL